MPRTTDLPNRIISHLRAHPTATRDQLAQRLGVSRSAIDKQLTRLIYSEGRVTPGLLVTAAPDDYETFWILIETHFVAPAGDGPRPGADEGADAARNYQRELCEQIEDELSRPRWARHMRLRSVDMTMGGPFDIMLAVESDDHDMVGRFVIEFLRTRPTVERTSTSWRLRRASREMRHAGDSAREQASSA